LWVLHYRDDVWIKIESVMTYRVVLQQSEEGYSVSCPGLPGCWSQGSTETEALDNIRIAIQEYLETVADLTRGLDVRVVEIAAS
jgi:predicted RNase H-like HicB family nuclease